MVELGQSASSPHPTLLASSEVSLGEALDQKPRAWALGLALQLQREPKSPFSSGLICCLHLKYDGLGF